MKMFLLVTAFISFNALADVTNFKCDFTEITYVNQFSLEGSVDHDNGEFVNAEFNFELRHAGKEPRIESMNIVRSGNVQVFEAGTMYRQKTVRISSAIKGAELEYVNILVDVPPLHSSHIRFADGTTFFGSCKSI